MNLENTGVIEIPAQRRINYSALAIAILAAVLAIVGIVMASSADDHAGTVDKKVVALDKAHKAYVEVTDKNLNGIHVELSADATAIMVLNEKIEKLESKSVVAELAKELREGKASKTSVDILRNEMFDKADKSTVRRLARRMGKFDKRVDNLVELNKLIEVAPVANPVEQPPVAPSTPQQLPPAPVPPTPAKSPAPPAK